VDATKLDGLSTSGQAGVGSYLSRYGDDGSRFLRESDDSTIDDIFDCDGSLLTEITGPNIGANDRGVRTVYAVSQPRIYATDDNCDIDIADINAHQIRRLKKNDLADDTLTNEDYVHIGEQGTLSETLVAVKRKASESSDSDFPAVWLEKGNDDAGFEKIISKHSGEFADKGYESPRNIKKIIYEAVKNGDATEDPTGGINYIYSPEPGKEILVSTGDNGFIVTAFPTD
jgi:hypothetical protein